MEDRIDVVAMAKAVDPAAFYVLTHEAGRLRKAARERSAEKFRGAVQVRRVVQAHKAAVHSQRQIELQRLARELAVLERSVRK